MLLLKALSVRSDPKAWWSASARTTLKLKHSFRALSFRVYSGYPTEVCVDLRINIIVVTLRCLHHQTVSHRNAGSVSAEIRFLYGSPIVEPSDIAHD